MALLGRLVLRDGRLVAVDGRSGGLAGERAGPPAEEWWQAVRAQSRPRRPARTVGTVAAGKAYRSVGAGLRDRGVVRDERRRFLGVFPVTRWSEVDAAPGLAVRDRLARAMGGGAVDERTAALVLLVDACGLSRRLFPEVDRRARKARLGELSAGPWANEGTGEAVRAIAKGVASAISTARAVQSSG
ncbi:GPP34 family phosphoprotein [Streptomyces sp. NPDC090306]|uniref:GOLPH3/VPS74 family protein n=1 Tax=Streptomyces sp. NPDC090306 TaxID=3365961 RepID=UPI003816A9FF